MLFRSLSDTNHILVASIYKFFCNKICNSFNIFHPQFFFWDYTKATTNFKTIGLQIDVPIIVIDGTSKT